MSISSTPSTPPPREEINTHTNSVPFVSQAISAQLCHMMYIKDDEMHWVRSLVNGICCSSNLWLPRKSSNYVSWLWATLLARRWLIYLMCFSRFVMSMYWFQFWEEEWANDMDVVLRITSCLLIKRMFWPTWRKLLCWGRIRMDFSWGLMSISTFLRSRIFSRVFPCQSVSRWCHQDWLICSFYLM